MDELLKLLKPAKWTRDTDEADELKMFARDNENV